MKQIVLDKLGNIVKVAADNASRALSKLINEPVGVGISLPKIGKLKDYFVRNFDAKLDSMVVGICLPIVGKMQGVAITVFTNQVAHKIIDRLCKTTSEKHHIFSDLGKSTLQEVGNVVCGSFLTVFANKLGMNIIEQAPSFAFDMFGAMMDHVFIDFAQKADESLVMEVKFNFHESKFNAYMIFVVGTKDMAAIFKNLESI